MRRVLGVFWAFLVWGCAGGGPSATAPSSVERSEALPVGYEALGAVQASCRTRPAFGELRGAPATSLACDRSELERALREQAAARGGTLVAGQRCRQSGETLTCLGEAARPAAETRAAAPAPRHAELSALPAQVADAISIDFEPAVRRFARRPRSADEVTEYRLLPVGHTALGTLRARCAADVCSADQAQQGLRVAAGGLGASALVAPNCFVLDGERACVGTLAALERDPETDFFAR